MTIGFKIKQLRKDKKITQEKLAEHLNITCQAISRWENDLSYPEASLLPTIAHYFDVTIDALFGYENDSKKKN